jgi:nicotinamidase-related amidase
MSHPTSPAVRDSVAPQVDPANDYVAVLTPTTELDPARTCFVVVDLQYATGSRQHGLGLLLAGQGKLEHAEYRFSRVEDVVLPNTKRLIDFCRANGVRVVYLTYGSEVEDFSDLPLHVREVCRQTRNRVGLREHEINDLVKPQGNERVFNKLGASGFNSTALELVLRVYEVDTLLFAGVSTNMCVESTVRDAADRAFRCVVVEDCCGGDAQHTHDASITVMQRLYASVASTDEVIERLSAAAGASSGSQRR